jgi:hypothetical protein
VDLNALRAFFFFLYFIEILAFGTSDLSVVDRCTVGCLGDV